MQFFAGAFWLLFRPEKVTPRRAPIFASSGKNDKELLVLPNRDFKSSKNRVKKSSKKGVKNMSKMGVTATFTLHPSDAATVSQFSHHNLHDSDENHSNKNIVFSDTELNSHIQLHSIDELLHDQYDADIEAKNAKLAADFTAGKLSASRYESRQASIDTYKAKNAFTAGVLTIGDADTYPQILDAMGVDYQMQTVGAVDADGNDVRIDRPTITNPQQRQMCSQFFKAVFARAAADIDGPGLHIASVDVHLDEGGAPHAHTAAVNGGKTGKGKASTTMNAAIKEYLGSDATKDSRANLREYRQITDNKLLDAFNQLAAERGFDVDLELIRTGAEGGRSMKEYKAHKASNAAQSAAVASAADSIMVDSLTVKMGSADVSMAASSVSAQSADNYSYADNLRLFQQTLLQRSDALESSAAARDESLAAAESSISAAESSAAAERSAFDESLHQLGADLGDLSGSNGNQYNYSKTAIIALKQLRNRFLKALMALFKPYENKPLNHAHLATDTAGAAGHRATAVDAVKPPESQSADDGPDL